MKGRYMVMKMSQIKKLLAVSWLAALFFCTALFADRTLAEVHNLNLAANDTYVDGSIPAAKDIDRYKLTLPSAGTLSVTYQGWDIADSYFQLMDSSLETSFFKYEVYTSSDATPKTKDASKILEAGDYFINVFGDGNHYGKYRLKASFSAANNTETEPNNTFDSAMTLNTGTKLTGLISATDNLDFYKITVPSAQKVSFTFRGMIKDAYFTLWNADYEQLHSKEVYYGSEASPKSYAYEKELEAGTYYIKIVPYGSSCGRYILSWTGTNTAPETEASKPATPETEAPKPTPPETEAPKPAPPETEAPKPAPPETEAPPQKTGETIKKDSEQYSVTKPGSTTGGSSGEVAYKKKTTKAAVVKIPATVTVNGVKYKVTSVGKKAFAGNSSITKVIIGKNVRKISEQAFANCKNLKTIQFGSKVAIISKKAFYKCSSLTKIDLPSNMKKIGSKAFYGCTKLKKIIIRSKKLKKANVGSKAFTKVPASATVYVPSSKVKTYRKVLKGLNKKATIVAVM